MTPNDMSFVADPAFKAIVQEYAKDEAVSDAMRCDAMRCTIAHDTAVRSSEVLL